MSDLWYTKRATYNLTATAYDRIILFGRAVDHNACQKAFDLLRDYEDCGIPLRINITCTDKTPVNSVRFLPVDEYLEDERSQKYKYGYIISTDRPVDDDDDCDEDEDEDEDEDDDADIE